MSSRSFLRLETKGRRSGLPHIVQLRYAWLDGRYFVLGSNGGSDWSRNALAATTATVRLGDFLVDVEVSKAGDAQKEATLEAFAGKYGARLVRQWYPEDGTCLCLQPTGPAVRRG
ncbi:MAG TPA: nitroreductase/quinone reductase family protein, partial [Nitrososphaerales archaeon]|nr:nitroreductase/quinone reductase family protein [Nitrososphaerales archaeon]